MKLVVDFDDIGGEIFFCIKKPIKVKAKELKEDIKIIALGGVMEGHVGDFLIEGIKGEIYTVRKDIFEEIYTIVK